VGVSVSRLALILYVYELPEIKIYCEMKSKYTLPEKLSVELASDLFLKEFKRLFPYEGFKFDSKAWGNEKKHEAVYTYKEYMLPSRNSFFKGKHLRFSDFNIQIIKLII
jgi:hypothetical protein